MKRGCAWLWTGWLLICLALPNAHATEAAPLAADPALEQRLMQISEDLRCLVCQNESLAGSRAELALDLRREIRSQIKAGKTDAEILDFMVSRYGDFVLYRPPVKPTTWLLWFGPFVLLGIGLWAAWRLLRRARQSAPATLDASARSKAQALLDETEKSP